MRWSLSRNSTDNPFFPTSGSRTDYSLELAGGFLGGETEFQEHLFSHSYYQSLPGGFVAEAQERLAAIEARLPAGYRFVWGGQFENQQRAMRRLTMVVPVALLLIFVLLLSALGSFKSAALIMLNLPFAVVGGVAAMHVLGINLSVAAAIGFIAVLGVAVEDALVLVSFCDQLRAKGMATLEAVFEACRLRVRPLVMTTATTLLGLLPMLYATGAGSEIQKPLVAVIFGGMISSLLLELLVLPVLYVLAHSSK